MNEYLSKKMTFFSFWLMVGVVFIHSVVQNDISLSSIIQVFISHYLLQFCVPLFFIISGYLFFLNVNKMSSNIYLNKLKKRFKTLVVPYFIWTLLIFGLVYFFQLLPVVRNFFPIKFSEMTSGEVIKNAIVYPYNYPLWFIRELIIYILITPLIYLFLRYISVMFLVILFFYGLFYDSFFNYHIKILQVYPFFFFALGSYLGLSKNNLCFNQKMTFLYGVFFFGMNIICLFYDENKLTLDSGLAKYLFDFTRNFKNLLGAFFMWLLYDFMIKSRPLVFKNYYKYSFLIFVLHGIPTIMLVKISQKFLVSQSMGIIFYLLIPLFIIVLCIYLGKVLEKRNIKIYRLLTGLR